MLTRAQSDHWQELGYVVLPGFKSAAETADAVARANALVAGFAPTPATGVFSARDGTRVADDALLASAEQVHFFFEEKAFDAHGRLVVPTAASVNKIGHALHELDPVFTPWSRGPALAELARDLGLARPQVWQSQLIFKQPRIGGEVGWHQDASFFVTTPHTVTTFWFALEDATPDNGCLWVQPGGHRSPLRTRFVATPDAPDGRKLQMERLDPTPWPTAGDGTVALPVEAGTLVCFHGLLPHYSGPNRSPRSRLAYTLHATDAGAAYSPQNWLQRTAALPVRGFEA